MQPVTLILGSKCKDGVVLVSDRKISYQTGNSRYQNKLYKRGPISGLGELRNRLVQAAESFETPINISSLQSEYNHSINGKFYAF